MPPEMLSVAPSPEATKDLPPPPPPDFTARKITREPLPAAPPLETLETLGASPIGKAATSLRYVLAPIPCSLPLRAPPEEPPREDSGELPWACKLPSVKRGASAVSGGVKPEKEGGGGVFGGGAGGVKLAAGVGSAAYEEVKPEVAAGAALDLSDDRHGGGGRHAGGVAAAGIGLPFAPGAATLVPEDACLVKDSFGEIHVVHPVPNYVKIQGQSFESEAGATGAARNYRRQKSSMTVTVQDVGLSTGFEVPAGSSDSAVGSISAAISAALAAGVGWGAPRVEEAESTMMAKGFASSSVPPHPLLRAPT